MLDETVANQPPVHENKNRIAIQLLNFRLRNKPVQPHFAEIVGRGLSRLRNVIFRLSGLADRSLRSTPPRRRLRQADTLQWLQRRQRDQLVEDLASENLVHALAMTGHGRRHQQGIGRRVQLEMHLRMRQRIVGYERCDVRQFGRFRSQKLLARWRIEEEIANRDRSSKRQARFFDADYFAAVDFEDGAGRFLFGACFQTQPGNWQRLAAKSQRRDVQQVAGVFDFRGGVALEGEHGIVAHHAAAVVGNLDQLLPARLDLNANTRGTGVQRVLQQFLYDRRRTLDHLAGSDLVGNSLGKNVNLAHGTQEPVVSGQWPVASVTDSWAQRKGALRLARLGCDCARD